MSGISEMYPLELLSPTESLTLYLSLELEVGEKNLVAAISCFNAEGNSISELESLAFSLKLGRYYVYLGSTGETGKNWQTVALTAEEPIKRVEVEIVRWKKTFDRDIKDVVRGVFAGQADTRSFTGNPLNFVSIRGRK